MNFLQELAQQAAGPRSLRTTFVYLKHPDTCESPGSLVQILDLDVEILSEVARRTLDALDSPDLEPEARERWNAFKWRVHAFVTLQDVFDAPLFESATIDSPFRLWYFYYESKHLLTESILSLLHGFYGASVALLRPILEFTLLQAYVYRRLHDNRDYAELERYFRTGRVPAWHRLLKHSVSSNDLGKLVRSRLQSSMQALSESATHAYRPTFSPKSLGAVRPYPTFEGAFTWMTLDRVLQPVLWTYCLNFPALLCPVDVVRRFGFNPPVGLLVDHHSAAIVRRGLGPSDSAKFKQHADSQDHIRSLLEFHSSHSDLSDEEILMTWKADDGPLPDSVAAGHIVTTARLRAIRELMAWKSAENPDLPENVPDMDNLDDWASIQCALSKRRRGG